ncbi:Uncharacterised protein [Delftia tsuruhatensis]|uniref:hypothetical protein n=1 Tax=Delftia tsuruhatensis TaxID=180282 RepID=UPI001E78F6D4|nr:hypothetical protein [Delftia tsuruhatensis]CAB5717224.1 Uncharacterised protein [Delftia tsuruhatensis]CAC9684075.1 Uncharacterised protein [Delftia tsuruhatensis]
MLHAIRRLSLKSALLLMMVAQLLIPLLHSHFGTPNQAGLHIHAAPSRVADSHFHLFMAHGSVGDMDEQPVEPFEVDVQDALQPLDLLPMPLLAVIGLALLTLGLRAARMRSIAPRPAPIAPPLRLSARWRGRVIRPSPAQAPPLAS